MFKEKFNYCDNDPKKLFTTLDEIMGKHKDTILPQGKFDATVANDMAEFFMNKIHKINGALKDHICIIQSLRELNKN